jgi:hypothetical protein
VTNNYQLVFAVSVFSSSLETHQHTWSWDIIQAFPSVRASLHACEPSAGLLVSSVTGSARLVALRSLDLRIQATVARLVARLIALRSLDIRIQTADGHKRARLVAFSSLDLFICTTQARPVALILFEVGFLPLSVLARGVPEMGILELFGRRGPPGGGGRDPQPSPRGPLASDNR